MRFKPYTPAIVLTAATLFFAYDIIADLLDEREGLLHIVVESVVFFAMSIVLFVELQRVS